MASYINGKPKAEWLAEQQKKNGVLIVHRGTSSNGWSFNTYRESIVTFGHDGYHCFDDADITLRLNGKEYRLTGKKVEFKNRQWYVDGVLQDIPVSGDAMQSANDGLQKELTDALNVTAGMTVGSERHRSGTSARRVVMKNGGTVEIRRGGKTATIRGSRIEQYDGQWYADGKAVELESQGVSTDDISEATIVIHGDVENLATVSGNVTVNGSVEHASTMSGDIRADEIEHASTMSGNIHRG